MTDCVLPQRKRASSQRLFHSDLVVISLYKSIHFAMASIVRRALVFISISILIPFSQAYLSYPVCSPFYGRPLDSYCSRLLWQTRSVISGTDVGFGYTDTIRHLFVPAGMARPLNDQTISDANWRGRVELDIYRGNGAT